MKVTPHDKANPIPRLVLFGPPGAGKGTQAVLLCKHLSIPHISTGEMMREQIRSGSSLGLQVESILGRGELVSDELVIKLVRERVAAADCRSGYLLDGFPRTIEQATILEQGVGTAGEDGAVTVVIELEVPEDILLDRIRDRGTVSKDLRNDDSVEVAAKRLQVYGLQTAPVADYYRQRKQLIEVDGVGDVEDVHQRIYAILYDRVPELMRHLPRL